jgi:ribosomal protein S18 acetylase RimI-like enzyme
MTGEYLDLADHMKVRRADVSDAKAVAALFNEYRMFYRQTSDLHGAESYIAERLEHRESVIFVAEEVSSGRMIGFTQLYPSFSSISMRRVWILNDLFVAEDRRGRGAAQRLLDSAKAHAVETNAKGLALSTAVDNVTAQRLYDRNGYVRETEFYDYYLTL